jgi:hypothetical protein
MTTPRPTAQDALAEAVLNSRALLARYLVGFDDTTHTRQAPGLPNHVAWSLGHLALTMHRVAEMIDGKPLPAGDIGEAGAGSPERFDREMVAFGSKPVPDPSGYPALARCVEIYNGACERMGAAVRSASDAKLAETVKWGAGTATLGSLAGRMVFHNGMHTGQIADLRRALGFTSIFA